MSLRNKLAILSITLMSLMTIPTRAENDNVPVSSRIESNEYIVDITSPEGWQVTDKFEAIPSKVEFLGSTFSTIKFENGTPDHGCVVLFSSDDNFDENDDDDETLESTLNKAALEAFKKAFPGSSATSFSFTKSNIYGSVVADKLTKQGKADFKVSLEGTFDTDTGVSPATAKGNVEIDSVTQLAIATGKIEANNTSLYGATGVVLNDDYGLIITTWGADEATLKNDILAFSKGLKVTAKESLKKTEVVENPPKEVVKTTDLFVVAIVKVTEEAAAPESGTPPAAAAETVAAEVVPPAEVAEVTTPTAEKTA